MDANTSKYFSIISWECTPVITHSISGLKSRVIIIFELNNDGKKWSRIYFENDRATSEIPVKLSGKFGQSGKQQL